jgi:hypothetical protein
MVKSTKECGTNNEDNRVSMYKILKTMIASIDFYIFGHITLATGQQNKDDNIPCRIIYMHPPWDTHGV